MLTELFKKAIEQVPSLVLFVVLVWIFVKHLDRRGHSFNETMKGMHNDHLESREEMIRVIHENSTALKELSKSVQSCPLKNKS